MRIPLLKTLALAGAVGLSAPAALAQAQVVMFNFEGTGGDTQGWVPDQPPDPALGAGAQSKVQTLDKKPVGGGQTINAFNGTWLLEGIANRPIKADAFRGMKYTWATPQDWSATPVLSFAASMYANGANSELHQFRVRVIASTGEVVERIYDGLKSKGADDGVAFNSFVNDWQQLSIDLGGFAGVNRVISIEMAGRHADDANSGGTPIAADVNWGGNVQIDYVLRRANATAGEDVQPGLRGLSAPYPNPSASGLATLDLDVETAQRVTARVVDVLGRTVQTAFAGTAVPGATTALRVATGRLATGTYLVVVEGETFRQSRRLTVQ